MGFPFENATWLGLDTAMYMGVNSNAVMIYTLDAAGICVFYAPTSFLSFTKKTL